jgi:holin-like protein
MHRLAIATQFCIGIALLLAAQKIGDVAVSRLGLPVPGALVGMLLLLALFVALGRVPRPIALAAGGLLRHIMLFLMPVVAGVLDHLDVLRGHWLPFLAACLLGTALTLIVTAALLQRLLRSDGAQ